MDVLCITSPSFRAGGWIPKENSGFGEDFSPMLQIQGLSPKAVSIAVAMDDLSIPFCKMYNHWVLWNIPRMETIPSAIPHGQTVPSLEDAVQGVGYGVNCYRGPKPPAFLPPLVHSYVFWVYALDCFLKLPPTSRKKDLIQAMEGHILQHGGLLGQFKHP